jgi:hypothetical protein
MLVIILVIGCYLVLSSLNTIITAGNPASILTYTFILCTMSIIEDYKHRGPGFDSRALLRIFLRELGLERGPLILVIG